MQTGFLGCKHWVCVVVEVGIRWTLEKAVKEITEFTVWDQRHCQLTLVTYNLRLNRKLWTQDYSLTVWLSIQFSWSDEEKTCCNYFCWLVTFSVQSEVPQVHEWKLLLRNRNIIRAFYKDYSDRYLGVKNSSKPTSELLKLSPCFIYGALLAFLAVLLSRNIRTW